MQYHHSNSRIFFSNINPKSFPNKCLYSLNNNLLSFFSPSISIRTYVKMFSFKNSKDTYYVGSQRVCFVCFRFLVTSSCAQNLLPVLWQGSIWMGLGTTCDTRDWLNLLACKASPLLTVLFLQPSGFCFYSFCFVNQAMKIIELCSLAKIMSLPFICIRIIITFRKL